MPYKSLSLLYVLIYIQIILNIYCWNFLNYFRESRIFEYFLHVFKIFQSEKKIKTKFYILVEVSALQFELCTFLPCLFFKSLWDSLTTPTLEISAADTKKKNSNECDTYGAIFPVPLVVEERIQKFRIEVHIMPPSEVVSKGAAVSIKGRQ